jgi:hypothetical protein
MAMAWTHKSDSKIDAQRAFEELLRKTEAHLKENASLESKGGNRTEFSRETAKAERPESVPSNWLPMRADRISPEKDFPRERNHFQRSSH